MASPAIEALRRSLPYRALRKVKRALAGGGNKVPPAASPVNEGPAFRWSDDAREVRVETPEPPHNLSNVLYNRAYYTMLDHCARGVGRHMTPEGFKNNIVENERIVYLRDDATGEYFAISWAPVCRIPWRYVARAGLGYQVIENETHGLRATWRIFVPEGDDPLEVWDVTVVDTRERPREISVFAHVALRCDGTDLYGGEMNRIARYDPALQGIFVRMDAERHLEIDFPLHNGFLTGNREPEGWDANPGPFLGGGGRTLRDPIALERGYLTQSMGSMWPPIAALHWRLKLESRGESKLRILVGATDGEERVRGFREKYLSAQELESDGAFKAMRAAREALTQGIAIETPEPTMDRMLNQWVKLQCHYGVYWGRWGFCGYRDILQHTVGNVTQAPELSRVKILEACRHQYADGFALRGWRELDTRRYADSAQWLVPAVTEYIKETGDFALLEECAAYFDVGDGTVWEHLNGAMKRLYEDRGAHGLCLIWGGDWNDSLTMVGAKGRGESVWLSQAFARDAALMAELAGTLGRDEEAREYIRRRDEIVAAIDRHGWDGEWFVCAFDDNGKPVGSAANEEGRIYLNTQSWAQLGGCATDERWNRAWQSVKSKLDSGWGLILSWPTYTKVNLNIGRITFIRPGGGENGSVYTHGNVFMLLALLERGMADEALEVWRGINPDNPRRPGECLPTTFFNGFYGPDSEIMPGLGEHAWTTGSAAWMLFGVVELMLGLRRGYQGIVLRPCIPAEWKQAKIRRRFRGTIYEVEIHNPHGVSGAAVERIDLDGSPHEPMRPLPVDGRTHAVIVTLGRESAGKHYDWRPEFLKQ